MNIELANSAGFCFGVQRAIKIIYDSLNQGEKICTLGNIIHNKNMISELSNKGVKVIENIEDAKDDETIVIRSHGVSKDVYDKLFEKKFLDGTCPFVNNIHKIVSTEDYVEYSTEKILNKNKIVFIILGDKDHPEIKGIEGHCIYKFKTIANSAELDKYIKNNINFFRNMFVNIVAQTTYDVNEWQKCCDIVKNLLYNYKIFDTICNETKKRQSEASTMAKIKDLMIIVGDKTSSNTQKLVSVCNKYCPTILIENCLDLENFDLLKYNNIGITAGASTPPNIIINVINSLEKQCELTNLDNILINDEPNFEYELDKLSDSISIGKQISGIVTQINNKELQIDFGNIYTGYLPLTEISHLSLENIKIGDKLDCIILKIDDEAGIVTLSKKKLDKISSFNKLIKYFKANKIVEGTVTKILSDGLNVTVEENNIFIPESQISLNQNIPTKNLLDKKVSVKILKIDNKNIKGSITEAKKDIFWSKAKVGDKLKGIVKNLTDFGAFVDLDGLDGLIFISDLSWQKINHPSEVLTPGDVVNVYIKELDFDNKKVSLGYKNQEDNPWIVIKNNYKIGDITEVTVKNISSFGAFAEVLPGIDGVIYISEISNYFVKSIKDFLTPGQKIKVKIINIDLDNKKISLSLKALED